MKRLLTAIFISIIGLSTIATPASAVVPYCGITWGSLAKVSNVGASYPLTNVRTGQHECYDRMVLDFSGSAPAYYVNYVNDVYTDGEGALVPLAGGAKLQITALTAAYDQYGNPTYPAVSGQRLPGVNLTGYQTFREAKFAGSFEGYTTIGLGVRARLPFRAFVLDNRLVIDVAHRW